MVRHWGEQRHYEFNALWVARWQRFPWDRWVDTRIAGGHGLSYATERPPLEPRASREDRDSMRLLTYLMAEMEVTAPGRNTGAGSCASTTAPGFSGALGRAGRLQLCRPGHPLPLPGP